MDNSIDRNEVGVYKGSFDPPHYGHLEAVTHALRYGMRKITVTYKDINPYKPFRSSDLERREMLQKLFAGIQNVEISEECSSTVVKALESDRTVTKIHFIVGSDIFRYPKKDLCSTQRASYFVLPREGDPVPVEKNVLNGLPYMIFSPETLCHQRYSSTEIRSLLQERNQSSVPLPLPPLIVSQIALRGLYQLGDAAFQQRVPFLKAKKTIEHQIGKKRLLSLEQYPLSIRLGKDMGISGLSGDLIAFVFNKEEKACMVTKIFCSKIGNCESELQGMKIINDLHLPHARAPQLLFASDSVIGMSVAQGMPLTHLMKGSKEAVRLCARALLELHLARRVKALEVSLNQIALFEEAITKVVSRLQDKPEFQCSVAELKESWEAISQQFRRNPGYYSYTHGDPSPSNFIVDLDSNSVTFVDLSLFSRSRAFNGTPYGFAYNECSEAVSSLWIVGERLGLTQEEIAQIQKEFSDEYKRHAPADIATGEALLYFDSYWTLREVDTLLKKYEEKAGDDKAPLGSLITSKLSHFLAKNS